MALTNVIEVCDFSMKVKPCGYHDSVDVLQSFLMAALIGNYKLERHKGSVNRV